MAEYRLSKHAMEQLKRREISEEILQDTLTDPDRIESDSSRSNEEGQRIYFKRFSMYGKFGTVKVFVNASKSPRVVKSIYWASK